jgi:hypothetical protein
MGWRRIPLISGGYMTLCREDNDACPPPVEDWRAVFDAEIAADAEAAAEPPKTRRAATGERREGLRAGVTKELSAGNRLVPKEVVPEYAGGFAGRIEEQEQANYGGDVFALQ